jgi:SAM-dependent methyltransferase
LYNELYARVKDHPQIVRKNSPVMQAKAIAAQMKLLSRFLNEAAVFLELGPGDCQVSFEAARHVRKIYAVDVSDKIAGDFKQPENFELIFSADPGINFFSGSIDIAYSNQLMEHLHPDDAVEQLKGIYRALAQGGIYICVTPNRLNGPYDISRCFDDVATGFHLKEYTNREVYSLLRSVGFSRVDACLNAKVIYLKLPVKLVIMIEDLLSLLPDSLRRKVSRILFFRKLLGICLVATK